jgi:phosphonate transport system substrate-binding protein
MTALLRTVFLTLGLLCASGVRAELVLAVHPFKPATVLTTSFTPLTNYLGQRLGEPVTLRITKDYAAHLEVVGQNVADLAYMGPAPYVKLVERYGPRPLLARQVIRDSPVFHGKVIVRADSPLRSLADLKGKRVAFGDVESTMGHLVPRYMLLQSGVALSDLALFKFIGDHLNVVLGVLAGDFDAGAVKEDVFEQNVARGLRAIATSPPIPDHLFVARSDLPAEKVAALRTALLEVGQMPGGAAILDAMTPGVTNLVAAADSDYDALRTMLRVLRENGVDP